MNIDTLFDFVAQEIPSAPRLLVQSKMRETLREFFDDSKLWQVTLAPLALDVDVGRYILTPPENTVVARILDVSPAADSKPLIETRETAMVSVSPAWRTEKAAIARRYIPEVEPGALTIYPIPSEAGRSVVVKVAVYPGMVATTIPDWIGEAYRDAFVAGALARLQRLHNKPWTDLKEGARNEDAFQAGVSRARAQVAKSGTHGPTYARTTGFDEL